MEIFKKMFAEKILSFHEGTNRSLEILTKMPLVGEYISNQVIHKRNSKMRMTIGVMAVFVRMIVQFIKKYLYVAVFIYLPYLFMAQFNPLIRDHKESAVLFMFFMLSTICGSLANNTLLAMGDRDYLMVRVVLVSPYMNFLGRLAVKMVTDFVYFTIILNLFGVSFVHSLLLSLVTMCIRPAGEMIAVLCFDQMQSMYNNRNAFNGTVIALSVFVAYGMPLLKRQISSDWLFFIHPVFVVVALFIGVFSVYYLWDYPSYRKIMQEALHIKREI